MAEFIFISLGSLALLAIGYAAGYADGYRDSWLATIPKPDPEPAAVSVPSKGPLHPYFVASLQRVMAKNAKKDLN